MRVDTSGPVPRISDLVVHTDSGPVDGDELPAIDLDLLLRALLPCQVPGAVCQETRPARAVERPRRRMAPRPNGAANPPEQQTRPWPVRPE